jgi:hypothetical protein
MPRSVGWPILFHGCDGVTREKERGKHDCQKKAAAIRSKIQLKDLKAKKNPKGGAGNTYTCEVNFIHARPTK